MGGTIAASVQVVRSLLRPLVDFIFPSTCVACSRLLSDAEQHVCRVCWHSIPRLNQDHPLFVDTKQNLLDSGVVTDLVSFFLFEKEGVFQHLAHALKYDGFESVGTLLGRELGKAMVERGVGGDMIVPIPLHKVKLRERGFNQAEAIARGVSEITGIPVRADLVLRCRATKTQTKLGITERQKNVEDAFEVTDKEVECIEGKVCILIDDVITTGATIASCAKSLIERGAARVVAASAALAE